MQVSVIEDRVFLDRFLHHADIIQITVRSYRLKDRAAEQSGVDN